jgi:hypothetical protein
LPLPPELLAAYRNTRYVVFGEPPLVLVIGEHNPDLDELLKAEGATTAAFITAANPKGKRRSDRANDIANVVLVNSLTAAGLRCFEGEGRAKDGSWSEESALVVGISSADAEIAGRAFGQNAIVFVERGKAPELVVLDP